VREDFAQSEVFAIDAKMSSGVQKSPHSGARLCEGIFFGSPFKLGKDVVGQIAVLAGCYKGHNYFL
jgi:hypothetical protein